LRKALKLKASVFIIAWLALFVHNVIPHHHIDNNCESFGHLAHNPVSCTDDTGHAARADNEHQDEHVCSLSNLLFHSLNPEIFLSCSGINPDFNPDLPVSVFYIGFNKFISSAGTGGTCLLRAPPLS